MSSKPGRSARDRQARAAQLRAERERVERRRRLLIFAGSAVVVVALVTGIIVAKATSNGGGGSASGSVSPAPAALVAAVAQVPMSVINAVGTGGVTGGPQPIRGATPRTGKPTVLYIGAEYCPFCAAERWALIQALSRFGAFTGLDTVTSGIGEAAVYNALPTFSFRDASYRSRYLTLRTVEGQDRAHHTLEQPTASQEAILSKYDTTPYTTVPSSIPFVWMNDRYVSIGASYTASLLSGKTHEQIASALGDPNSPLAQGIIGSANEFTAALCQITRGQPASVCTAAGVRAAAAKLSS